MRVEGGLPRPRSQAQGREIRELRAAVAALTRTVASLAAGRGGVPPPPLPAAPLVLRHAAPDGGAARGRSGRLAGGAARTGGAAKVPAAAAADAATPGDGDAGSGGALEAIGGARAGWLAWFRGTDNRIGSAAPAAVWAVAGAMGDCVSVSGELHAYEVGARVAGAALAGAVVVPALGAGGAPAEGFSVTAGGLTLQAVEVCARARGGSFTPRGGAAGAPWRVPTVAASTGAGH